MIEVVWSINIMIAILIVGVAWVLYYIFTYDQKFTITYLLMIKNLLPR